MRRFYQIWWIALIIKTAIAIWLPFSHDEAYYWVWGHHPQWSYYDHPPMVGWIFALGRLFENFGNGARLPGIWLGHLTLLIWAKILTPFLSEKQFHAWLIFTLLSPFFGLGSLVITPDVPLLFFWSLSLLLFLKVLEEPKPLLYAAFGATLGLSFCSKYMTVLFVPIALTWIAWSKSWSKVRWRLVPLTIASGLCFSIPVLYWNFTHDWVSFRFQLQHGLRSDNWSAGWPFEYIGGQILILFPTVVWLATRRREPSAARFLHFFGWLPLGFFFYTSFKAHVEANWPIMAHPSILALAFLNAPDSKTIRRTAALWAIVHVLAIAEASYHWLPIDQKKLKTAEFSDFDIFLPLVASGRDVMFGSYQMAASVSYKTRRQFYKVGGMNRRDFYDFLPQSFPEYGNFVIASDADVIMPAWLWEKGFENRGGSVLSPQFRTLEIYRAKDAGR